MNETMVYMGPSIRHVVQHGTALKGGYPPALAAEMERQPYMKDLMIPAAGLAEARRELKKDGSQLAALYRRIEKGVNGYGV